MHGFDDAEGARSPFLNVAGKVKRAGYQRVGGNGGMWGAQRRWGQWCWEEARIPDFETLVAEADLNGSRAAIITVRYCVYDRFPYSRKGNLRHLLSTNSLPHRCRVKVPRNEGCRPLDLIK